MDGVQNGGVGNDSVVAGRNHGHGKGVGQHRLVILTGEGQRTKLTRGGEESVVSTCWGERERKARGADAQICGSGG